MSLRILISPLYLFLISPLYLILISPLYRGNNFGGNIDDNCRQILGSAFVILQKVNFEERGVLFKIVFTKFCLFYYMALIFCFSKMKKLHI